MLYFVFDMDGVLTHYDPLTPERMYDKGYFLYDTIPNEKAIQFFKGILKESKKENSNHRVMILTKTPAYSVYTHEEKRAWLKRYIPEMDLNDVLIQRGELPMSKREYFLKEAKKRYDINEEKDLFILFDDYTKNCVEWDGGRFKALKVQNGLNDKSGKCPTEIKRLALV